MTCQMLLYLTGLMQIKIEIEILKGKRPLRIPRHLCECNFKINLEGTDGMVWTGFTWLRRRTSSRLLQT